MKAKDTIMGEGQYNRQNNPFGFLPSYTFARAFLEVQAEISFKAGYERGMREADPEKWDELDAMLAEERQKGISEVVAWIDANRSNFASSITSPRVKTFALFCSERIWKAKLKEWEINEQ